LIAGVAASNQNVLIDGLGKRKTPGSRPDFPAGEQDLALPGDPAPGAAFHITVFEPSYLERDG